MTLYCIPYLLTMFLMLSFIVIDIGSFFNSTLLKETNPAIIRALFFFLVAATARSGIEVMVRMFTMLILVAFFFVVIIWCMAAPNYHLDQPAGFFRFSLIVTI
ncbi:hypothetical protein [Paenibacillus lignilyticus]|uniref:Uncharacterized protein n=1 Tax=Paenibacillus lignilyticus TaxID=1172615 RepID=A0ABS5C9A1_9BACL|nr:hypothetical protein [Paenibacillus lignilyticus]MBP3962581.1 hypothetical protein [Paenibacillus lignilyticus]